MGHLVSTKNTNKQNKCNCICRKKYYASPKNSWFQLLRTLPLAFYL